MVTRITKPVTRQELYDLAWNEPMLRVAERFGVSSSYLARVFTELRIPRPPLGYWAKREFGKAPPRPDLPATLPGELAEWTPRMSVGSTNRMLRRAAREMASGSEAGTTEEPRNPHPCTEPKAAKVHELLVGVRPLFLKTREVKNGILKPYKRLLVDVMSSEARLDDALSAAQSLFSALEKRGFRVAFSPSGSHMSRAQVDLFEKPTSRTYFRTLWSPDRTTVAFVHGTCIGLTLFEMTEEVEMVYVGNSKYLPVRDLSPAELRRYSGPHYWRTKEEYASGRLCLQSYFPYWGSMWTKRWQESKPGTFKEMIPAIIRELEAQAPELAMQAEQARIQAEEEHRRWQEAERLREIEAERERREKAAQDSRRDLLAAISAWDEARRVRDYFESVEAHVQLLPAIEAAEIKGRLHLARALVGTIDPLARLRAWRAPDEVDPDR